MWRAGGHGGALIAGSCLRSACGLLLDVLCASRVAPASAIMGEMAAFRVELRDRQRGALASIENADGLETLLRALPWADPCSCASSIPSMTSCSTTGRPAGWPPIFGRRCESLVADATTQRSERSLNLLTAARMDPIGSSCSSPPEHQAWTRTPARPLATRATASSRLDLPKSPGHPARGRCVSEDRDSQVGNRPDADRRQSGGDVARANGYM